MGVDVTGPGAVTYKFLTKAKGKDVKTLRTMVELEHGSSTIN